MESGMSRSWFCAFCKGINLEDMKSNAGYVHQPTCDALMISADTCDLCQLILSIFKHCIYEQRLATSPIRDITDARHLGPLRLFAASRELDSKAHIFQRRERTPVKDRSLSVRVAMTLDMVGTELHYGPEFPTLFMFAEPGSFAESMGVVGHSPSARGIQDDPICDVNISKILNWARNCEQHHDACSENVLGCNVDSAVAPRRLIDVGLPGQLHVRLVQTHRQSLKYAALSYCWGANQAGKITTDETVNEMMQGVSLSLLSQTIQDAVLVVRKLGIPYLWVDALCIIQDQDHTKDWMDELNRMGQIYNRAYLTIAATSASAASQGFLAHQHRSGISIDIGFSKNGQCGARVFFKECTTIEPSFGEDVERSPLLQRAWVKQERILSRRTVDFSSRQIYWTCQTSRYSEDGQEDADGGTEAAAFIHCLRSFGISLGMAKMQKNMMQGLFFRSWADLIQEYSALQLTYESDRLPALAGIADIASRIIPGHYLSGIWEANLSDGLLWKPAQYPAKRSAIGCIPSWSWASVIGPVETGGHNPDASRVEILGTDIHKTGKSALHLVGRVHRCTVDLDKQPPSAPCRSDRKLKDLRVEIPSYAFSLEAAVGPRPPDAKFENSCIFDGPRGGESVFYALGVGCNTVAGIDWHSGLLLRMMARGCGEDVYERVGKVQSSDRFWYAVRGSSLSLI